MDLIQRLTPHSNRRQLMKTLNQAQVKQVAGGAIDPVMGLFPKSGIALIDKIHAGEWKSYGRPLYNAFAAVLGAPKAP
jgi:hypothetical protein